MKGGELMKIPDGKITRTDYEIRTEKGEEKTITVETRKREGYNDPEIKAWIPPLHEKKLVAVDGVPFQEDCNVEVKAEFINLTTRKSRETVDRINPSEKLKRFEIAEAEDKPYGHNFLDDDEFADV